jgi:hypothetical protein
MKGFDEKRFITLEEALWILAEFKDIRNMIMNMFDIIDSNQLKQLSDKAQMSMAEADGSQRLMRPALELDDQRGFNAVNAASFMVDRPSLRNRAFLETGHFLLRAPEDQNAYNYKMFIELFAQRDRSADGILFGILEDSSVQAVIERTKHKLQFKKMLEYYRRLRNGDILRWMESIQINPAGDIQRQSDNSLIARNPYYHIPGTDDTYQYKETQGLLIEFFKGNIDEYDFITLIYTQLEWIDALLGFNDISSQDAGYRPVSLYEVLWILQQEPVRRKVMEHFKIDDDLNPIPRESVNVGMVLPSSILSDNSVVRQFMTFIYQQDPNVVFHLSSTGEGHIVEFYTHVNQHEIDGEKLNAHTEYLRKAGISVIGIYDSAYSYSGTGGYEIIGSKIENDLYQVKVYRAGVLVDELLISKRTFLEKLILMRRSGYIPSNFWLNRV